MEPSVSIPLPDEVRGRRRAAAHVAPARSAWDRRMRRLLRLPEGGAPVSAFAAQSAFGRSIALSATRCLLTYVLIPLLGPVVGLTGSVGPALGLALGTVSIVAIVASTRRFFAADHRWRWRYAAIGGGIVALLVVQAVLDTAALGG